VEKENEKKIRKKKKWMTDGRRMTAGDGER
jgi:hypothetical protein